MSDKYAAIIAASKRRMELTHEIQDLKREQQRIDRDTVQELIEAGAYEAFSINWRTVHRMFRR